MVYTISVQKQINILHKRKGRIDMMTEIIHKLADVFKSSGLAIVLFMTFCVSGHAATKAEEDQVPGDNFPYAVMQPWGK